MLTIDTIRAAQNNDLAALGEVISETESRVSSLARKAANRMAPHGGNRFYEYADEFTQVGRVAVWDCLSRFTDTTVEAFERYVYVTIETTLKDAVRSERNGGADEKAVKTFAAMLELADGDAYEAVRLAQIIPEKGSGYRLSADRAEAARLAWQGALSIDATVYSVGGGGVDRATTLADTINVAVEPEAVDEEIRPKTGHGAALEALKVLCRYTDVHLAPLGTPALFAANLPTLVALLEDTVTLPRDAAARRYVLDAMGVLRAAVSTATESALTPDLRDVRDDRQAESNHKHERVRDCVESLGAAQRDVIKHSFGLDGMTDYGWGDGCDVEGLCAALGMTSQNVRANRSKGRKAFAKRYVAAVKLSGAEAYAAELEAAAAANSTHGGRK
ncbi:sigma-70 family RNA polymerase sigma factor [Streptomyces sp. DHE17-7]|uniref:sigma-70 family RNA polymerase sigma factor n=1 Tax=Streptomyces sp. DHE17-7 TaxID=2759949 RepID=UPI0022EB7127|nr:sigma-70 family RNA polymerase sigma factor [Streptomyces sp. DHE17-7]MBJ6623616.1 sigma-70 family RNA polymerase sigma factor [Streptomyces sp. DHE17-7]